MYDYIIRKKKIFNNPLHAAACTLLSLSLSLVLISSPTSVLASGLAKTDWPTWGGNAAHNKISPSTSKAPLTIYFRTRPFPNNDQSISFRSASTPILAKNTLYALTIQSGSPTRGETPYLMAYDLHGRELWRTVMPKSSPDRTSSSAYNPVLSDDGTIYVGWLSNSLSKGITAFNTSGNLKFAEQCGKQNGTPFFLINMDSKGNVYWMTQDSSNDDWLLISCYPDGSFRYGVNHSNKLSANQGDGFGPVIDSNDVVYAQFFDGMRAIRGEDGSVIWNNGSTSKYINLALSPDEQYLASNAGMANGVGVRMIRTSTGASVWQYFLGNHLGTAYVFGLHDIIYVFADSRTTTGLLGVGSAPFFPSKPPTNTSDSIGALCALDVPTGKELWCRNTLSFPQNSTAVVDSNNTVYFESVNTYTGGVTGIGIGGAVSGVDETGKTVFQYVDIDNFGSSSCIPIMSDDGKLFVGCRYLEGFRPWTLTPTALKKPAGNSTAVYFTVKSSMLKRDLQEGVTADNQAQVRLDGGRTISLKYLHQDGDDTVWEGVYSIPAGADLSQIRLKGQIEAIANQTTSALITHFASIPGGFNNTGMVQPFDLGTADKLSGTAAQSNAVAPDDFTQAYQTTINWIRDTSHSIWSYLKHTYSLAADFVMR